MFLPFGGFRPKVFNFIPLFSPKSRHIWLFPTCFANLVPVSFWLINLLITLNWLCYQTINLIFTVVWYDRQHYFGKASELYSWGPPKLKNELRLLQFVNHFHSMQTNILFILIHILTFYCNLLLLYLYPTAFCFICFWGHLQ